MVVRVLLWSQQQTDGKCLFYIVGLSDRDMSLFVRIFDDTEIGSRMGERMLLYKETFISVRSIWSHRGRCGQFGARVVNIDCCGTRRNCRLSRTRGT